MLREVGLAGLRYNGPVNAATGDEVAAAVRTRVADLQRRILEVFPDTRFRFEPTANWDIWHLSVFTPSGAIQMPPPVIQGMVALWHDHRVTVITTVYPLSALQEQTPPMADVRPFRGLRYDASADVATRLAPPYDVIGPQEQEALYAASEHNVIRVELGRTEPNRPDDNRYTRARDHLAAWTAAGVLRREAAPAFYLVRHAFRHEGIDRARWELLAQVRLAEWAEGVVLPHEFTLPEPKVDRLNLLQATRTNTSHIYCLYRDPQGTAAALLDRAAAGKPALEIPNWRGAALTLWTVTDPAVIAEVQRFFASARLYIADGHHRYETALGYRRDRAAAEPAAPEDAGFNFVFMSLTSMADPGLLVLPIHRMLRGLSTAQVEALRTRLYQEWDVEPLPVGRLASPADVRRVEERLAAGGDRAPRFAFHGLVPGSTLVAQPKDLQAMRGRLVGLPASLQALDLALLHETVIHGYLGTGRAAGEVEAALSFTHHAPEALEAVAGGAAQVAILVNPTRVDQLIAVAEAGDKMPQKSTFFYPKLPTGLVMRPLDGDTSA